MISKSRSSHKSRRSRSRSREDDRHRRNHDRHDSRISHRSDERYHRHARRGYSSKESSRFDRDRGRTSSKSSRDYSDDRIGRSHRDSGNSRSSHSRNHHSGHRRDSTKREDYSRDSLDASRHHQSESSTNDSHSRRSSTRSSTQRNDLDNQGRLEYNLTPHKLPMPTNHLSGINRAPLLGNLPPANLTPLIPNPAFMTPSMLTPPSTSALIPTALVPSVSSIMPRYYNPSTFNATKYAIQEEKKKLLWGPAKKEDSQRSNKVWQGLQFPGAQGQQMTEKFLKLMGSKPATSSEQLDDADSMVKYQETLFKDLDKQYSAARMSTHVNRGIGLGFSSQP